MANQVMQRGALFDTGELEITDENGDPVDLSGATLIMELADHPLSKTQFVPGGRMAMDPELIASPDNNMLHATLPPAETFTTTNTKGPYLPAYNLLYHFGDPTQAIATNNIQVEIITSSSQLPP